MGPLLPAELAVPAVAERVHETHIPALAAALAVTTPTALYSLAVWLVHNRTFHDQAGAQLVFPASAALVLAASFAGHWAVPLAALAAAAGLAVNITLVTRGVREGTIEE